MKRVMKESSIKITQDSLDKLNNIISNMDNRTFHNHYHILYDLCSSFEKKDLIYLEIGTFAGGSASLVSSHKSVVKVVSVDLGHPIQKEIPINNVNKFKNSNCVYKYIEGDSTSDKIKNQVYELLDKIDILFIDGDHKYQSVSKDFENYKNLVSKNGYIIFDDYMDSEFSPDVFSAVNDIVKNLNPKEYQIIGSLTYDLLNSTNYPNLISSNEFIIKKLI